MRITGCTAIVLIFCSLNSKAQFTKEVPLKPIYKQGWKYFYGGKKMNSAYSLQIPLQSLDNKEINDRFKKFKTLQHLGKVAYIPALVYLLTSVHFRYGHRGYTARDASTETFGLLVAGGILGNMVMSGVAHHQLGNAIDLYNIQIANKSSLGFTINPLQRQATAGLSFHFTF